MRRELGECIILWQSLITLFLECHRKDGVGTAEITPTPNLCQRGGILPQSVELILLILPSWFIASLPADNKIKQNSLPRSGSCLLYSVGKGFFVFKQLGLLSQNHSQVYD